MITVTVTEPTEREVTITMPESVARRLTYLIQRLPSDAAEPLDSIFFALINEVGSDSDNFPYRISVG